MFGEIYDEIKKYIGNIIENLKINTRLILYDRQFMIFTFIMILFFVFLFYFIYNKYIKNHVYDKHVLNREFITISNEEKEKQKLGEGDIVIVLFKTEWCPYCKSSMEEWNSFREYIENVNKTNTKKVFLNIIDCDENKSLADKYEIEAYPSVKMFYNGEIYDYDARISKEHLIQFIESTVSLE
tara:strand:+ start:655 stop:1203 length:549 start_codon:yes stop_codon:yes gene_type:complete